MLVNSPSDFDFLQIGLASPDRIRFWSYGEIEKPETINYRTFKPERKGLFCEKIFGPVKDWECSCGKYRRVRYRGIVCERCGVEVTHSKVRRERMGHIELAAPVSHIWFLKGIPSYMGLLLDMSSRQLEEVIYYDSYIVTETTSALEGVLEVKQVLSQNEYVAAREKYGEQFKVDMGASAIRKILTDMDLRKLTGELRKEMKISKGQKKLKVTKRLRIVEALDKSGNQPQWMILDAIPVMPPDLRPMVQLEGGRFATSDLNDLYRRVVNRNNRLKRLMDIGAPDMIVRNEKRMLQEAVDVLISNGKRGRSVTGANGRPLKSLGNIIEGKQGRFRQNLLGKRVDYSARSVIVVGPHLKFNQCGLPKEMALELFKPFIIRRLVENGIVSNVKSAKKKIEKRDIVVWDILESVIKGQLVLLNRAPTLHRLGIQAFEPKLVEGSAIQVHPLVCTAFNADFDGDQMAVHVPLSIEAQTESRLLIMSTNNILSPSSGRPIITPSQDMTLGCYFLTVDDPELEKGRGKIFADTDEALRAWESKVIDYHSQITVKIGKNRINTTIGRIIFNRSIWDVLNAHNLPNEPFVNEVIGKKQLSDLIYKWFISYGNVVTAELADQLKRIGFKYSTLSGISISVDDLKIPKSKAEILDRATAEAEKLVQSQKDGAMSRQERQLRSNDIWREATQVVAGELEQGLGRLNNLYIMANSGARGNMDQVRQLAGMRGLMSDAQGRTVNIPIKSNFKEGLSLTEYFISSYGARKGLVDTALRTADSGYLTRRLVDVAQDVMVTMDDCGAPNGIELTGIRDGLDMVVSLAEMIEGRFSMETITNPATKKVIINAGELITAKTAQEIEDSSGKMSVKVRSIYKCDADRGICQKCFGIDLSSGQVISIGEAVGIIAAQSIGEPGTQLTMRTFHTGGVDLRKSSKIEFRAKRAGKVEVSESLMLSRLTDDDGEAIWVSTKEGTATITEKDKQTVYSIPTGSIVFAKSGTAVKAGEVLAEYDPTYEYVVSESDGIAKLVEGDFKERKDKKGKVIEIYAEKDGEVFVYDPKNIVKISAPKSLAERFKKGDRIHVNSDLGEAAQLRKGGIIMGLKALTAKKVDGDKATKAKTTKAAKDTLYEIEVAEGEAYPVLAGARLFIKDKVRKGEIIARERVVGTDASKTKDIVQGLPRVEELFEARRPKDAAVLSEIDGIVDISDADGYRVVTVIGDGGVKKDYKVAYGIRLKVFSGKDVLKGEQLTEGVINPHDILLTKDVAATQTYLSEEVQRVYRSQGVQINSKHIEVIVRQMTRKVNVTSMGDSENLPGDLVDIRLFERTNKAIIESGKEPAEGERVLLGITRSSLSTESFVSASSFQQTASVLTRAAIEGQIDPMYGLKENVIIGKLIPAGTGFPFYNRVGLDLPQGNLETLTEDEMEDAEVLAIK